MAGLIVYLLATAQRAHHAAPCSLDGGFLLFLDLDQFNSPFNIGVIFITFGVGKLSLIVSFWMLELHGNGAQSQAAITAPGQADDPRFSGFPIPAPDIQRGRP